MKEWSWTFSNLAQMSKSYPFHLKPSPSHPPPSSNNLNPSPNAMPFFYKRPALVECEKVLRNWFISKKWFWNSIFSHESDYQKWVFGHIRLIIPNTHEIRGRNNKTGPDTHIFRIKISKIFEFFEKKITNFMIWLERNFKLQRRPRKIKFSGNFLKKMLGKSMKFWQKNFLGRRALAINMGNLTR